MTTDANVPRGESGAIDLDGVHESTAAASEPGAPAERSVWLYGLSVPERLLRASLGVVGGAAREAAALLVPSAFEDSKTYSILVRQTLRFLTEDIAGVKKPASGDADEPPQVDQFVARKAVGNFVEMAGLATLHLSPLIVLAVVSDVAYGSTKYLTELADELKREGIIDEQSSIRHAGDLLQAVGEASGRAASTFDTPPLSVEGLREAISDTTDAVKKIDPTKVLPQAEIERMWSQMREISKTNETGLLQVSGAMSLYLLNRVGAVASGTLSGVRVAGSLFDRLVIDHYRHAAAQIKEEGLYASLARTSEPYIEAVWFNFSTARPTITEDLLSGRLIGKMWRGARGWMGRGRDKPEIDVP
jgi:hypothetical protein